MKNDVVLADERHQPVREAANVFIDFGRAGCSELDKQQGRRASTAPLEFSWPLFFDFLSNFDGSALPSTPVFEFFF